MGNRPNIPPALMHLARPRDSGVPVQEALRALVASLTTARDFAALLAKAMRPITNVSPPHIRQAPPVDRPTAQVVLLGDRGPVG